jgi:hypothetical protein
MALKRQKRRQMRGTVETDKRSFYQMPNSFFGVAMRICCESNAANF